MFYEHILLGMKHNPVATLHTFSHFKGFVACPKKRIVKRSDVDVQVPVLVALYSEQSRVNFWEEIMSTCTYIFLVAVWL